MWYNHPRNRVKNIQYIKVKSEKLKVQNSLENFVGGC